MKLSKQGWQELRDYTRLELEFETPSADLDAFYFLELRDAIKGKHEDPVEARSVLLVLLDRLPEPDREPFLAGFDNLDARVAELEAAGPPDYRKLIRERMKQKPSRADAPLIAAVEKALGLA